jgi:5'-nucleotidase
MNDLPLVLLSNDDGVESYGLWTLEAALQQRGFGTLVAAPKHNQSGKSSAFSFQSLVEVERKEGRPCPTWSIDGTPVDCIKLALASLHVGPRPTAIVSGINYGSNAGRLSFYSGTVGAAIEGALQGIPSLAFSSYSHQAPNFEECAPCAARILATYLAQAIPSFVALNVNFPSPLLGSIKGVRITRQGMCSITDVARVVQGDGGKMTISLDSEILSVQEHEESDVFWLERGYATITPVLLSSQINSFDVSCLLEKVFAPLATL